MTSASLRLPARAPLRAVTPARARNAMQRLLASPWPWLVCLGLLTRVSVFGDLGYTDDELFYFMVGQRAHEGLLPYVDIWDRKGPGLFLTYYLIAGISYSVVVYQVAAALFALATSYLVSVIAGSISNRTGAIFAGVLYLALLPLYGGGGGQSPVFYNFYVALAAWLIVSARTDLARGIAGARIYAAMTAAGVALTFKQSAVVEAGFLGAYCLWELARAKLGWKGLAARAAAMALCGAAPILLFAAAIAWTGHFGVFWQAMVGANLHRTYYPASTTLMRAGLLAGYCAPPLLLSLAGILGAQAQPWHRRLLGGWLLAAAGGIAIMPNFFEHYALPLMVPASIASGLALAHGRISLRTAVAIVVIVILIGPALRFGDRARSREAMGSIVARIQQRDPHPRLLVYEGPVYLYRLLGSAPPSPLLFPMHLYHPYENNAGPFDTGAQMRRILAWKPTVVVRYADPSIARENPATAGLVRDYTAGCRLWFVQRVHQVFETAEVAVYGDCRG